MINWLRVRIGILLAITGFAFAGNTAPKKGDGNIAEQIGACAALLGEPTVLTRFEHLNQHWSLVDLVNPDPAINLAVKYPTTLMNNDQMDFFVANKIERKQIKDPAYRRNKFWYYPLISAGVPEAGGYQIIGHYDTIQRSLEYVEAKAKGKRATKMLGYVGPAGTGKTEIGNLLVKARGILGMTDPDYFQLTFEFTNLQDILSLSPLLYGMKAGESSPALKDISLQRSPFVLLPPNIQKNLVAMATPYFRKSVEKKKISMDPLPFGTPSGKTKEVIDAIIAHYARAEGKTSVTDQDYLRWLTPHVRIVRRIYETQQAPPIIRYLGKHPDMSTLFFTENLALSQFYGPKNPLSYAYGLIPDNDGKPLFVDEFFRQSAEVRDSFLDLAQNGVAQNGGAPPESLNVTIYFATNDDSIEEAKTNGGAKAHLNRTIRLPMRHAIEPWHVVKIAINDIGRSRFTMRKIQSVPDTLSEESSLQTRLPQDKSEEEIQSYNPQEVIPDLESGDAAGTDGRYALYYRPDSGDKPVLIAARSLWMMGLVAAGTRLVTDQKKFEAANAKNVEFSTFQKYKQYFVNAVERLHVLNGTKQVDQVVAEELQKVRDFMKEGQEGIGAREVENWLSEALSMARNFGGTVTPVIMDRAFQKMLNSEGITASPTDRTKWIQLMNLVKAEFILPALTADVLGVLQGHGRAERLYDDIKMEILALSTRSDSDFINSEGGHQVPIDKKRLNEVYNLFREISGYDFDPGLLKDFHLQVSGRDTAIQRLPALMEAVRRYLSQREIDKSTISELVDYFNGKAVSEDIRAKGALAEKQFAAYGYDRSSFVQALMFVRDQQFIIDRDRKRANQP